jgi:hypothetical protein
MPSAECSREERLSHVCTSDEERQPHRAKNTGRGVRISLKRYITWKPISVRIIFR